MLTRPFIASALAFLLLAFPTSAAEPEKIHFADDFVANSLKDYQVEGDVTWQKGQVTLGKGAKLTRKMAMGHTAEVKAAIRFPAGKEARKVQLRFQGDKVYSEIALARAEGKMLLVNLEKPIEKIPLDSFAKETRAITEGKPGAEPAWVVRFEVRYGVARAKAWPMGKTEPKDWQTVCYSGRSGWEPQAVVLSSALGAGCWFVSWDFEGIRRAPPLNAEQQKLADRADKLNREGEALYQKGQARQAVAKAKEALELRQQVLGPEHPDTAESLNNLGGLLQAQGDYAAARPFLDQALAIRKKVLGPEHPDTAGSLNNLGSLLQDKGDYVVARPYLEQALAICQKVLGPEHPDTAASLNNLGGLIRAQGDYTAARPYLEQALAIRKKVLGPDHPHTAESLSWMGSLLHLQGDYGGARPYYEQALAICKKVSGPEHPDTAACMNNQGELLQAQGNYAVARPYYEQALSICKKGLGPEHPHTATCLNNLGALLQAQGDYTAARPYYEQALAIRKKVLGPNHPETGESMNNLGFLLRDQGDYAAARPYFEQALANWKKVLGPEHPHTARSLNNLGVLLQAQGDYVGARPYCEQAMAIWKKVLGPEHQDTATSLNNLGSLLAALGETKPAWEKLAQGTAGYAAANRKFLAASAQRDFPAILGRNRFNFERLVSLAAQHPELLRTGGPDLVAALLDWKATASQALAARQEALTVSANPDARDKYAKLVAIRSQLARLLLRGPGREGIAKYREQREKLEDEGELLERELAVAVEGFAVLRRRHQTGPKEVAGHLASGAVIIDLVKFRPFDFQAKGRQKCWGEPQYAAVLLSQSSGDKAEPVVQLVLMGEAQPIEAALRAWREAAQEGGIDLAIERTLHQRVWERLAKALPEGTKRLLIAPDGELARLPFEAIRLEDDRYLVERFHVRYLSSGRDLMPTVTLGSAHAGPLPRGERRKEQDEPRALVVADPDYDALGKTPASKSGALIAQANSRRSNDVGKQSIIFKRLPGFAKEADAVMQAWQAARPDDKPELLSGTAASEEQLAALKRPRLLYLITHGFFLPDLQLLDKDRERLIRGLELVSTGPGYPRLPTFQDDPRLRSGLALAGANKWRERSDRGLSDGLLTALEVENLDLWGTELVVLSACETGLGEVSNIGEGVLGLRRAFQNAGAQTVIASLWKVPDKETERLMTRFFELWLSGKPKAEALRTAQLEMIQELRQDKDEKRRGAPPLLWAGFICHGKAE